MAGNTLHFKSAAAYHRWVAYGQMHGVFHGKKKIKIHGKTHKVNHGKK